jgi:serine/threonine protein kinase
MNLKPTLDQNEIDRQLAELDDNPNAVVDTTVREVHAELQTLLEQLKQPVPLNPYEQESACQQAVERVKALSQEVTAAFENTLSTNTESMPTTLDHFRIVRFLGQGGMGAVYLAEDTRLGRDVALKTMRADLAAKPSAKERFLREARLAAALEHDHIVPIYHVGEADGIPYLAMPFLKGQSLDELLKTRKTLSNEQVIRLGIQVAQGLAAAHERGLIHRDIKPANLWVEPKGRIKILDFGLARADNDDIGLTQSGIILGTPSYMAPEQARGLKVDGRADLYSLGVVLYRSATGQLPIKGVDSMSMLMALATETPHLACEANPAVSPALSALIMRLLAKDPDQRPDSSQTVIQELQALLQPAVTIPSAIPVAVPANPNPWADIDLPDGETKVQSEPARPAPESTRRRPRRWPLVAAGLLFAFVGGGLLLQQIILRITDKDGKTHDIELMPGDRIEIVEKPADKSGPAKAPPKKEPDIKIIAGDPDRRAAEYVLSIGGQVQVNDENQWIDAALLPKVPFRLTGVNLERNQRVTDAGLANSKDCKELTILGLTGTWVSDDGLAHFKDCKNLTVLGLLGTRVSDDGLAHFKDCKNLWSLNLNNTRVTDVGLANFKECKYLSGLSVNNTRVTDEGLAHFKNCKELTYLDLGATKVTDTGLAHLKGCDQLTYLDLSSTQVTDAGFAYFKDCDKLRSLLLSGTQVTDVGLAHLKNCKNLTYLYLIKTQVTANFIDELKAALPKCKIEWDGAKK